jgi:hypothetical protein
MKEEQPVTPPPGPIEPFTARDGVRLFSVIDSMTKRISSSLEEQSNRLAIIQKSGIEMTELLRLIEAEFSESRIGRLELEIQEAERERDIAERNLKAVEEKLLQKQSVKDQNVDTNERIKSAAAAAYSDLEKKKKESSEAFLLDLKRSIVKAVLTTLAVGAVSGTIAFIWFLVQLYLNRGAP